MIGHMRHGSPPRLLALQSSLSPNRRESLPTPSAGVRISRIDEHLIRAGEAGLPAQVEPHRAGLGQVGGPDMMLNLIPFIRRQHRPKRAVDADEAVKVATPVLMVEARRLVDHEEGAGCPPNGL